MDKETEEAIDRANGGSSEENPRTPEEIVDLAKLTAEAPPTNSVKLTINSKGQLTGEVMVYGNDMMAAYIEAFKIISIIKAKNEKIE